MCFIVGRISVCLRRGWLPRGLGFERLAPSAVAAFPALPTPCLCFLFPQVTIVEKADSCSVLPSPLSISTRNRMTFLFANLKDRDFLVQRISDFLQQTTSRIYSDKEFSGSCNSSDDEVGGRHLSIVGLLLLCSALMCAPLCPTCLTVKFTSCVKPPAPVPSAVSQQHGLQLEGTGI